jgi:hypothetical protein
MNLEQAIHQRWADTAALEALLPAARLATGRSQGDVMPYATLAREQNRAALRTNAGDALDETILRIDVWCEEYDAGHAIAEQVKAAFDRSAFDLSGGDRVVQMRRSSDSASQDADGVWRFTLRFLVHVHLPSGV